MTYKLTGNESIVQCLETGAWVSPGTWLWEQYETWLAEGNTPLPAVPAPTLDDLKAKLAAAATALRWEHETGGIELGGVRVGTTLDDQNRISGVLAAINLGGLDAIDFKAASGWVLLSASQLQGIAQAVSAHIQACFTAERKHHEAIAALSAADEVLTYDTTAGWPA